MKLPPGTHIAFLNHGGKEIFANGVVTEDRGLYVVALITWETMPPPMPYCLQHLPKDQVVELLDLEEWE